MAARRPPLGQHFLHDPAISSRIVDALDPDGAHILEIGPGKGALTFALAGRAARLVAVELDRRRAGDLDNDPELQNIVIVHGDVLSRPLPEWMEPVPPAGFLLAGNLPYAITSPVLFACFDAIPALRRAVLMMQREVAERLVAGPGSRTYGILSVFAAVHAETDLLFRVGPGAFRPPPRVTSAVVRLDMRPEPAFGVGGPGGPEIKWFRTVVKAAFGQRRKMLRNSLGAGLQHLGEGALAAGAEQAGVDLSLRAENLAPEDFARLARALPG